MSTAVHLRTKVEEHLFQQGKACGLHLAEVQYKPNLKQAAQCCANAVDLLSMIIGINDVPKFVKKRCAQLRQEFLSIGAR